MQGLTYPHSHHHSSINQSAAAAAAMNPYAASSSLLASQVCKTFSFWLIEGVVSVIEKMHLDFVKKLIWLAH